jgi:hypothetical protein
MRRISALGGLAIVAGVTLWAWRAHAPARVMASRGETAMPSVLVPHGTRVRVEVLNTTRTRGLARRVTYYLRDRGFDVVDFGTGAGTADTTLVIDRSGHPEWAAMVARALGGSVRRVSRPDTSRYLDVTVVLGNSWRPPAEPLYP